MISLPTMCLCKPTSGRLRPSRIVGTGERMMGGGGACAVLAHWMPLPWVRSSSPIGCLSLGCGPPRPSDASPLGVFLLADRMPLPWVRSSSPIECLSLGCGPPRPSDASPLGVFLLAHRMPLPWVRSLDCTPETGQ